MIPYTGNPLDRKSDLRQNPDWVAAQRGNPNSLFLPLFQGAPLLTPDESGGLSPAFLPAPHYPHNGNVIFLGLNGERALFAFEITAPSASPDSLLTQQHKGAPFSGTSDKVHAAPPDLPGQFVDLRRAAPHMAAEDLAIAAGAKALVEWHNRHPFCSHCGNPTEPAASGHMRHCPACGADSFPRIDPAVIVLVTDGERCALARNAKWEDGRFSTIAGFVEAGEGIEETVVREVQEEIGLHVTDVRYFASQPWPYPAALMLGFFARCDGGTITVDPAEIAEAYWFTRKEARALLDGTLPDRHGPMTTAIAHKLISAWLDGG